MIFRDLKIMTTKVVKAVVVAAEPHQQDKTQNYVQPVTDTWRPSGYELSDEQFKDYLDSKGFNADACQKLWDQRRKYQGQGKVAPVVLPPHPNEIIASQADVAFIAYLDESQR
jgi:hypothetical protein